MNTGLAGLYTEGALAGRSGSSQQGPRMTKHQKHMLNTGLCSINRLCDLYDEPVSSNPNEILCLWFLFLMYDTNFIDDLV